METPEFIISPAAFDRSRYFGYPSIPNSIQVDIGKALSWLRNYVGKDRLVEAIELDYFPETEGLNTFLSELAFHEWATSNEQA